MKLQPTTSYFCSPVNFTAMKKSQFNGIDYAVVEKFKPPIEKFNTNDDLQEWAEGKCDEIMKNNLGGQSIAVWNQRESGLRFWDYNLKTENNFMPTEQFLILNGITKHLKPDDKTYLPSYNKTVLEQSINDVKMRLNDDKNCNFNFGKIYRNNLKEYYNPKIDKKINQWIVIPSKSHDRENFETNIERLQELSSDHWCTKSTHAKTYLANGDMHIYLEHGKPKFIIRMDDDAVMSFFDELNNRKIPKDFLETLDAYIEEQDLFLSESARNEYNNSKNYDEISELYIV